VVCALDALWRQDDVPAERILDNQQREYERNADITRVSVVTRMAMRVVACMASCCGTALRLRSLSDGLFIHVLIAFFTDRSMD
jgi:hypothetical protein